MKKFTTIKSIITPFDKVNVDTDQIVPKQFLKLVQKSGFGKYLFYNWRFISDDTPNPDFILNDPKYAESKILVTADNFGCGSSREHAVWALQDFGFDVIISSSFADIFYNNCFKNGVLPIILPASTVQKIQRIAEAVEIDLQKQTIVTPDGLINFEIDSYKKNILLQGLDDIAITFQHISEIESFEKKSKLPSVL